MAKYKDYPIYTYDEPAIYKDFSGGINTDPSNEHLLENELRDCLNMHYSSAALVKRKGASLLCNIECDDELFNIQGVFLFTYKITYIIIAADGKLYQGFYSPKSTIRLTRLPIIIDTPDNNESFNPLDITAGLEVVTENLSNIQHEGYIYNYVLDTDGTRIDLTNKNYRGEWVDLPENSELYNNDIVLYNNVKFKLVIKKENISILKQNITPENSNNWISLNNYNTQYTSLIAEKNDMLSQLYQSENFSYQLIYDEDIKVWREELNTGPAQWSETYKEWKAGTIVSYKGTTYICMISHINYTNAPIISELSDSILIQNNDAEWIKLSDKKELIFQNNKKFEAATYNNKLYLTTGTRFIVIEVLANQLVAQVISPYICNTSEIINIGQNYLSPYPEFCRETKYNQVITSIGGLLAIKNIYGKYTLLPQMSFAQGESEEDYYFKWEKKINNEWVVLYSYKDNIINTTEGTGINTYKKINLFTLEVDDADKYYYRVSFAKSFEKPTDVVEEWDYNKKYNVGDLVSVYSLETDMATEIYRCVKSHDPRKVIWDTYTYKQTAPIENKDKNYYYSSYATDNNSNYILENNITPIFHAATSSMPQYFIYTKTADNNTYTPVGYDTATIIQGETYWEKLYTEEPILRLNDSGYKFDWIVDKVDGEYFGSATSILFKAPEINDKFKTIHTCTKIVSDGNKFLLYGDRYNSGSWYKTVIDNPSYITDRGCLSFKTNKNEELIKVTAFNGNIIAFANSESIGGSIHLITGNGDDWDDSSGYYSPYRRSTINSNISCDNADTVQVCENIIVFKYFNTLYYISGSELTNEVVSVYSCNDKIKHNNNFVQIPWNDNSCISEVTDEYYALIWKEKHYIENGELLQERPALKVKMYYKLGTQQNEKIVFPWLRDESEYFNINHILYIKGQPIYLYNNTLTTFNEEVYTDYDNIYKCKIHFRGEDLNYPKMYKLINNILVYYHRNQYSKIDFSLTIKNEAGHILLNEDANKNSLQDLRALRAEDLIIDGQTRLDSTILDSKVFNTQYKFPCLLADTIIESENDKEFSISSITYNYITSETPDQTAYDLYTSILRPKETYSDLRIALRSPITTSPDPPYTNPTLPTIPNQGLVSGNNTSSNQCVTFIHEQALANSVWEISHNLNRYPSVTVVDSGGDVVYCDATYVDKNKIILSFQGEFGGKAYLN